MLQAAGVQRRRSDLLRRGRRARHLSPPGPVYDCATKHRPLSRTTEAVKWSLPQGRQLRLIPPCCFNKRTCSPFGRQIAKNVADQKRIHSPTPKLREHVEIEKMRITLPQWEVMGLDRASLQGPAVTSQPICGLDQPQHAPLPNRSLMFRWASLGFQKLVIACRSLSLSSAQLLFCSTLTEISASAGCAVSPERSQYRRTMPSESSARLTARVIRRMVAPTPFRL